MEYDNDITGDSPSNHDLPNVAAASCDTDDLAPFSSFGATAVDLAAPGIDILSARIR